MAVDRADQIAATAHMSQSPLAQGTRLRSHSEHVFRTTTVSRTPEGGAPYFSMEALRPVTAQADGATRVALTTSTLKSQHGVTTGVTPTWRRWTRRC
eukprot:scaffold5807_cov412-Prasinococcus_capsulatus_cf.AAC.6